MQVKILEKEFKSISNIEKQELKEPFICYHTIEQSGYSYFSFLVVDLSLPFEEQLIARFRTALLAEEYIHLKYNLSKST